MSGCAGYTGSKLLGYLLSADYYVVGLDNFLYDNQMSILSYLDHPNFKFVYGDCRNISVVKPLVEESDAVILLAAIVGAPACDIRPQRARETNYESIVDTLPFLKNKRILWPNTNSGYGATDGKSFCTEEDSLNPISLYGKTKCDAEKAILAECPNSVIFRLATVFGVSPRPRFDLLVNDWVAKLYYDRGLEIYEPEYKRNFVHVRDVCRAFMFALGEPRLNGIYNLGLPEANISKINLAHKICEYLNISKDCCKIGSGTDPDKRNYLVSNNKILNSGFRFQYGLGDGIMEVSNLCKIMPKQIIAEMKNI